MPEGLLGATQQTTSLDPCRSTRAREVAKGGMGVTKPVQDPFFVSVASAGVEFGGYYCAQDCTLKDPHILAQPQITLLAAETYINFTIE